MDKKDVLEILESFNQSGLAEIRFRQGDHELILKRWAGGPAVPPPVSMNIPPVPAFSVPTAPQVPPAAAAASTEPSKPSATNTVTITAPIVGTFYRSAAPDAPAFVEEGQEVKKGQTLCILEAMKNMNQLEAEFDCVIVKILVPNATLVEYGAPLFEVVKK